MELSQKYWRRIVFLLSIVSLLSPNTIEGEAWGPLDAISFRRIICNIIWSYETEGFQTMIGTTETSWMQFPYLSNSPYTIGGWIMGCLSLIVILFYFSGRIKRYEAILILGLILIPLIGLGGVSIWTTGSPYMIIPLPIPQIIGFTIILLYQKPTTKESGASAGI